MIFNKKRSAIMEQSLINLLEESILVEGRLEQVIKKYQGAVDEATVRQLSNAQNEIDPAINNKYLDWMVLQVKNGQKIDDVIQYVDLWHKNLAKIDEHLIVDLWPDREPSVQRLMKTPKDINVYDDFGIFKQVAKYASEKLSKKDESEQIKSESRLVYSDERYEIRVPMTHRASCKYGAGTKWCTTQKNNAGHYNSYMSSGILFYVMDKSMADRIDHPQYKLAVYMKKDGSDIHVFNVQDNNIGDNLSNIFPQPMVDAMARYREKYNIDYDKLNKSIIKNMAQYPLEYQNWKTSADVNGTSITNGRYNISIEPNIKGNNVKYLLRSAQNVIGEYLGELDQKEVRDLENIYVENGLNTDQFTSWVAKFSKYINSQLPVVLGIFEPILARISTVDYVTQLLKSKSTKPWIFAVTVQPTQSNPKLSIQSDLTLEDDGKPVNYTIKSTIDFDKKRFVFQVSENVGRPDKVDYEEQANQFNSDLSPEGIANEFITWVKETIDMVWESGENEYDAAENNAKKLKSIVGNYKDKRGTLYTVTLDSQNNIDVYSEQTKGHYLIRSYDQFIKKIFEPYGLKKIK